MEQWITNHTWVFAAISSVAFLTFQIGYAVGKQKAKARTKSLVVVLVVTAIIAAVQFTLVYRWYVESWKY